MLMGNVMRRRFLIAVTFLSAITSCPTRLLAQPQTFTALSDASAEEFIRCADKAGLYEVDQALCASDELDRQADILERAYRTASMKLNFKQRQQLESSQRKWIVRRDLRCHVKELALQPIRGTFEIIEYKSCLATEIMDRIRWLEKHFD